MEKIVGVQPAQNEINLIRGRRRTVSNESLPAGGSKTKFNNRKRLSWDEFFMQMATAVSERTACLFHKVGSVFVDDNHRIISLGYNGSSTGDYNCNEVGCAKVHGDPITGEIRRCRGAHGEINAIINSGNTGRLRDSTLYITLFPCYDCMKALNNAGVKRIVYYEEYLRIIDGSDGKKKESEPEAWELARKRGIIVDKYQGQNGENQTENSPVGGKTEKKDGKGLETKKSNSKENNLSRW